MEKRAKMTEYVGENVKLFFRRSLGNMIQPYPESDLEGLYPTIIIPP